MSFTKAAEELHLTQSAVSHRVRALEDELGIALFECHTRRLELTQAGRSLAHRVDQWQRRATEEFQSWAIALRS